MSKTYKNKEKNIEETMESSKKLEDKLDIDNNDYFPKKEKFKSKIYFSYEKRLVSLIVIFATILVGFVICFRGGIETKTKKEIAYRENGNIDYSVYLKDNDYYNSNHLGKDRTYIASLIDNIKINFNYDLKFDKDISNDVTYKIIAKVYVIDKNRNNSIIYDSNEVLDSKKIKANDLIHITDSVTIDYDKYNNLVRGFKTAYSLSSESYLEVSMNINTKGDYSDFDKDIKNNSVLSMKIPLTEQTVAVESNYNEINKNDKFIEYSNTEIINYVYFIISIILFILLVIILIYISRYLIITRGRKSSYKKRLNKILKEYDRVIVNAKHDYDYGNLTVIDVKTFEELLDVKDNVEGPIVFVEINSIKSVFLVKHQESIYRYTLKDADLEK